jgi:phosphatidylglycerol:prolipoprotein diacylglycerol transferase
MHFPSPIAFWLGPWPIHWYGLAYSVGLVCAWAYGRLCLSYGRFPEITPPFWDGLINVAMLGIVIGGRLGHFILYSPQNLWTNPLDLFKIWTGGMAFHGGMVGLILVMFWYARRCRISFWSLADITACGAPLGLGLVRCANFVNQEVYGAPTDQSWGVVFPAVDALKRHPSQLYEAMTEGVLLFLLLASLTWLSPMSKRPGRLSGVFLWGYSVARIGCEFFRVPDGVWGPLTMAQWYCLPMIFVGCWIFWRNPGEKWTFQARHCQSV